MPREGDLGIRVEGKYPREKKGPYVETDYKLEKAKA